jgi:DNA-binding CsgD family transcriptional regulator
LELRNGQSERALRLAGASDALYEHLGTRRPLADRQKLDQWLVPLRETFGQHAADAVWADGRALEFGDTIALALGSDEPAAHASTMAQTASVLTAREHQVAALLTRGLSNRQIAEQLVITERTVASHVEHILEKLGFASRHQVGAWMVEHDVLG